MIQKFLQRLLVGGQDQDTVNCFAADVFEDGSDDALAAQVLFKRADESNPDDHRIIGELKILRDLETPDGAYDVERHELFEVTITPISPPDAA